MNFSSNFYISLLVALVIIFSSFLFMSFLTKLIRNRKGQWYGSLKIRGHEILDENNIEYTLLTISKYIKWLLVIFQIYLAIPYILKEEESTKIYADSILNNIFNGVSSIFSATVTYIPNLVLIFVIIFISKKLVQFVNFIFSKIENKALTIENFYPEWASTTKKLATFFIITFTFVIIYPYLPGSGSKALEGVSVFLGLLISLGSSSAISNIIAGVMLTYMRSFKIGDYIKAGNQIGQVIEKGMTVTKLCTFKNEIVVLPNTQILNSEVINYSEKAKNKELILHTTVTLGYDTPWTKIHSMLLEAASLSKLVNQEKGSFVLQTSLNDFHISYELNVHTEHVALLPRVYNELHQNIQSVFSKHQVEIMSPAFNVYRSNPKDTTPLFEDILKNKP
jgi:small-conductance mechanosensitive channel